MERHKEDYQIESNKQIFAVETIEKQGNIKKPKTFNNQFNDLQLTIINLLKYYPELVTTNNKIDYGKMYLRILEDQGKIKILDSDNLLSPESPDRILRKLMEYAEYGNNELSWLIKFKKNNGLDNESKEYYRNN